MLKYSRYLIPLTLLLTSCFTTRKAPREPDLLIVDPVELSIDTTYNVSFDSAYLDTMQGALPDTIPSDSLLDIDDECDLFVPDDSLASDSAINTLIIQDSLVVQHEADTITIIGTGDIMPGTNYPDSRYLPPGNDCSRLFEPVADVLRDADVTFGNLEGVLGAEGGTAKKCNDPSVCYVFRMPSEYLECILDAGYDVLSVANNHVNDFGQGGRISTAKHLEDAGVPYAGFQSKKYSTFEIDSVKYGFAAFAPHTGTVNLKDYQGAVDIVRELDSICDIVIVSFHGGAEGKDYQHVPCTDEMYLGYNRGNVCKFSHLVIDAGADVVFGHGPHVTRAMELYKDRLICYSLGNFCTYARFNLRGPNGLAPIVKVFMNKQGAFLGGKVIPVYQTGEGGPRIDTQKRAIYRLIELSKSDFPENKLLIDENGNLSIK